MRSRKSIEETIRTRLNLTFDPPQRGQLLARALREQEQSQEMAPAISQPAIRRTIMKNSIVKLGIAAAIIAVIGIGIVEFLGTGSKSGVVWAEVARKVEANRGFIFHQRLRITSPDRPEQVAYVVAYHAGSRVRQDYSLQPEGQLFKSSYYDFDAKTATHVRHDEKTSLHVPLTERTLQSRETGWLNPKDWVRQVVSSKYTELGRGTIEGVQCEGIETTDPTFADANPPATSMVARLWVGVETGYPVQLEVNSTHDGGKIQFEALCGRFQWDVELSPSLFEPDIPPDYKRRP
jgi:outer membrane lipoprotein-sorting protein